MNGFHIDCHSLKFPGPIEAAVLPLLSKYWLVCTQGGPFSTTDKPNFEELEAETSSFILDVSEFRDSDLHLFRPGVFPQFLKFLVVDEWTYLFALDGPAESAKKNALELKKCWQDDYLSRAFFGAVATATLGFFMYVDEFWEVYLRDQSSRADLLALGFTEIDSDHWLHDRRRRR
jgi:hypothetical protein